MASSLHWLPKLRNTIITPILLKRALTVSTSYTTTAVASNPDTSQTVSTLKSVRHEEYGRLLPCPSENTLPRNIEHLVVREEGPILDFIAKALDLPPLYVADLIHFGAVHYALVCPKPPLTATSDEIKLYKEFTKPSVLRKRPSIKGKTVREAQNTFRVTQPDQLVEAGTYVRVHVRPKRFPRYCKIY
ncbi:hypothetical protein M8C21_003000, partial [Ambrosia artemisiifolia]